MYAIYESNKQALANDLETLLSVVDDVDKAGEGIVAFDDPARPAIDRLLAIRGLVGDLIT